MRKLLIAVVVSLAAMFAFTSVASAQTLRYSTAKRLAVKLAEAEERKKPVESWRIFGAERTSARQIVWVYNVDYADGSLCDAELVVRIKTKNGRRYNQAFFRDVHCEQ